MGPENQSMGNDFWKSSCLRFRLKLYECSYIFLLIILSKVCGPLFPLHWYKLLFQLCFPWSPAISSHIHPSFVDGALGLSAETGSDFFSRLLASHDRLVPQIGLSLGAQSGELYLGHHEVWRHRARRGSVYVSYPILLNNVGNKQQTQELRTCRSER